MFEGIKGAKEQYEGLREQVNKTNDQRQLFGMLQSLREVMAKETGEKASFKMQMPDGTTKSFENLEEAQNSISGYKSTEVTNNKASTAGRIYRRK